MGDAGRPCGARRLASTSARPRLLDARRSVVALGLGMKGAVVEVVFAGRWSPSRRWSWPAPALGLGGGSWRQHRLWPDGWMNFSLR
ncbi:hypothetical protein BRADI_2g26647v3 [Brachypodium distachyon]|uniref:Uncharacterized protein n=1 Tax=Brachypodium distachyon TaxID=15368 RepID=A0A2K2DAR7_BRADI|nr:hypothetical protein BRADI_2g26647v3 [Brachypodium distachyon]